MTRKGSPSSTGRQRAGTGAVPLGQAPLPSGPTAADPVYHVELGMTYLELGSLDDAAEAFRRAIVLDPSLAEAHFNLATVLTDQGDAAGALSAYRRAVELRPDFFEAHFNLGEALAGVGRLEEAVDCYRRAGALNPTAVAVHNNLATVLIEMGAFDEAIETLQRAIALAPKASDCYSNLGTALKYAGRFEDAVAAQRRAAELAPNAAEAHFNLGMALAKANRHDEAEPSYRQAIALQPSMERAYVSLGGSLMSLNRHEEALALCDEYLDLVPAERTVLAFKAVLLEEMGRRDAARDLADYDRLIQPVDIAVPDGYDDLEAFNDALVRHVLDHPSLVVAPTSHATVKGRHTGNLLVEPKGPFADFEQILWQAAEAYAATRLPDPAHAYLTAWPALRKLVVWSVVMDREGHQVPHIHPSGWLSGVYYPELPRVIEQAGTAHEGWIEFGMPPPEFPTTRDHTVKLFQPKEGRLFLFPSYFYHRTVPYHTEERRISIAFDFLPAR